MTKAFILFLCLIIFMSCTIKNFVMRGKQIDMLPVSIDKDSVRNIYTAFSMHQISDKNKKEYSFRLVNKERVFHETLQKLILLNGLSSIVLLDDNASCIRNKMHAENWREEKWLKDSTYQCINMNDSFYNILLYSELETIERISYSAAPMNDLSDIASLLLVFKNKKIVYSKKFRYAKSVKRSEEKQAEKDNDFPFFKDDQIKHVVQKITEDLFKRIK